MFYRGSSSLVADTESNSRGLSTRNLFGKELASIAELTKDTGGVMDMQSPAEFSVSTGGAVLGSREKGTPGLRS